ncbi:MAG: MFS transporter [Bacteroidales bacterium]
MNKNKNIEISQELKIQISKDGQIKKFSLYGFLKNLRFFEPYLVLYLMTNGFTFFQLGILFSIKEIVVNIFEIPSGFIADRWGYKNELILCFILYIISFIFFFSCTAFWIGILAVVFFGLAESCRSGTHKAMILIYLENKDWNKYKTFVYGRTRSFSLLGSSISAVLSILILFVVSDSKYLFIASIIPYILDAILILSYPSYLNKSETQKNRITKPTVRIQLKELGQTFKTKRNLISLLVSNGIFESVIKSTKDLIQPMLKIALASSGVVLISSLSVDNHLKIILGLTYCVIYIISSMASRNAYRLNEVMNSRNLFIILYLILGVVFIGISATALVPVSIITLFLIMYLLRNLRKPVYVDVLTSQINKDTSATIFSISSQLESLLTIILVPIGGYIADHYGIKYFMLGVGIFIFLYYAIQMISRLFYKKEKLV